MVFVVFWSFSLSRTGNSVSRANCRNPTLSLTVTRPVAPALRRLPAQPALQERNYDVRKHRGLHKLTVQQQQRVRTFHLTGIEHQIAIQRREVEVSAAHGAQTLATFVHVDNLTQIFVKQRPRLSASLLGKSQAPPASF